MLDKQEHEKAEAGRLATLDVGAFRDLASVLGEQRIIRMTAAFFADADARLSCLDRAEATCRDLQDHAHALISMAGHLGLARLSALCMDLQERARCNTGLDERPSLRQAVEVAREAVSEALLKGVLAPSAVPPRDAPPTPTRLSA